MIIVKHQKASEVLILPSRSHCSYYFLEHTSDLSDEQLVAGSMQEMSSSKLDIRNMSETWCREYNWVVKLLLSVERCCNKRGRGATKGGGDQTS